MRFIRRLSVRALLAGCSGGGGGGGSVDIDDLAAELANVSCSKIFDRCTSAEVMSQFDHITYEGQPITTEAQCEGFSGGVLTGLLIPEYKASIAAGRIVYDGDAAARCLDAMANLTCSSYAELDGHESIHCDSPFIIPNVADGAACAESYECITGNCVGAGNSNADGACMAIPTMGQDCTGTCADGLYCGFDESAGKETCQALKADGMTCLDSSECSSNRCMGEMCTAKPAVCDGM